MLGGGLSQTQIDAYHRDGIIFPIKVLSIARSIALRRSFDLLDKILNGRPARWTNLCFPWAYDLSTNSGILDSVGSIIGPDIVIVGSIMLCKHPGSDSYVAWHQDGAYSGTEEVPSVSAWVALADSNSTNGCMRVIPGTQGRLLPHRDVPDNANLIRPGQRLAEALDEELAVDVVLRVGEMSLHHDRIVHGSRPNCGADKRIGFVVRYTTPAMSDRGFPMIIARGTARCTHLRLAERPRESEPSEMLANYLAFCDVVEKSVSVS
jgi:non-haem Fe2+, alpha-ketoglutarate-dependent halogenase